MNDKSKLLKIGLDIGDTVFNRTVPRITVDKGSAMQPCEGALEVISSLEALGHEFFVISKIGPGSEASVSLTMIYSGLVPKFVSPANVRFCYTRSDKGPILKSLGVDIHVDDRIEVLNAAHEAGIPHKILFVGIRDDRNETECPAINFEGVYIAKNWIEVKEIIEKISIS